MYINILIPFLITNKTTVLDFENALGHIFYSRIKVYS